MIKFVNLQNVINIKFKYHMKRLIKNCIHLFKMLIKKGYYPIVVNISIAAIKNLIVIVFFFNFSFFIAKTINNIYYFFFF